MSYLPDEFTHDTVFPKAFGKDVHFQIRSIAAQYRRFYPVIEYRTQIVKAVPEANMTSPAGQPGESIVDPLYGDILPSTLHGVEWEQPHLSGTHTASEPLVQDDSYEVHSRVQRVNIELELKKHGVMPKRLLDIFIPSSLLDEAGITCRQGDRFEWDGEKFVVLSTEAVGYWKNTNIRLYLKLEATHVTLGS